MPCATHRIILMSILASMVLLAQPFAPAQAQAAPHLSTLVIDLWPEFDRPASVLVIYRGEFAPGTPVPESVKIRIPASAGAPSALASPEPGKETAPVNQWMDLIAAKKVTTTPSGDWTEVTFTPLSRVFTIEFYDKLNTVTFDRQYTFTWPGDLAADAATLNVREPFSATDFQATPTLPPGNRDDEGLLAHQLVVGALNAGQAWQLTLSYHREDQRTSVEALQLVTPVPTRQPIAVPAADTSPAWPLFAALGVGLALIAGGVVWYIRSQSTQRFRPYEPPKYAHRKGRRSVRISGASRSRPPPVAMRIAEDEPEEKLFCTQCGRQLNLDDTFCPRCGTRVKGK